MQPPARAGLAVVALALLGPWGLAASAEPVTEREAIRLFLRESPQSRLPAVNAEAALSGLRIESEIPNPSIAYQIEDAAGVRDEFFTFQQPLPVTGRRGLLRERSEAAADSARHLGRRDLGRSVHGLRAAFYRVLYGERASGALRRGVEDLERLVEMLRIREEQGEGSGYDLLRAEEELLALRVELARAVADLDAARAAFHSYFAGAEGGAATFEPSGDFETGGPLPSLDEAIAIALAGRGDLLALEGELSRQELELKAAGRERLPEPVLTAGWKRVSAAGEEDTGFMASLTVPIPIFGRGANAAARARAGSDRVELEREMRRREIRAEVAAALARAESSREAAMDLGDHMERRGSAMRRIAEISYREGETGILELMDGLRTSLGIELRALAARHDAVQARIDLDRAMGSEVTP